MAEPFDKIKSLLAPTGLTVYQFDVPETPSTPYVLLWGNVGDPAAPALDAVRTVMWGRVGVTVVDLTANNAIVRTQAVRAVLQPNGQNLVFTVQGREWTLVFEDSQDVQVDRAVESLISGVHPSFAVDVYRVHSQKAPTPSAG